MGGGGEGEVGAEEEEECAEGDEHVEAGAECACLVAEAGVGGSEEASYEKGEGGEGGDVVVLLA